MTSSHLPLADAHDFVYIAQDLLWTRQALSVLFWLQITHKQIVVQELGGEKLLGALGGVHSNSISYCRESEDFLHWLFECLRSQCFKACNRF